jgi:putative oxidoreductase
MRRFYIWCADQLMKLWDLPQLFFRLILAYGFYKPMVQKVTHFSDVVAWFASMDYPVPTLAAVAALSAEILGVILLPLGLLTRVISLILMFLLGVAIVTVHWPNGFVASHNGYEIPLYYSLMLFSLVIIGPGRISLDGLLSKKIRAEKRQQREQKKAQQTIATHQQAAASHKPDQGEGHHS